MASLITYQTIDGAYPVAGIDNDTQGFRDNFTIIKDGLAQAQSEISSLQSNTAKLNRPNDFAGTEIISANFSRVTEEYHNIGTVVDGLNISLLNGMYQTVNVNLPEGTSTISFVLSEWPPVDHLAKLTVQLKGNDSPALVSFALEGGGTIKYDPIYPLSAEGSRRFTVDSSEDPILVDFWSYNQGTTVYANYRGRYEV